MKGAPCGALHRLRPEQPIPAFEYILLHYWHSLIATDACHVVARARKELPIWVASKPEA
jgi:hypothetical protein